MRKAAMFLLTAAAVMILPRIIVADDAGKPVPPGPEQQGPAAPGQPPFAAPGQPPFGIPLPPPGTADKLPDFKALFDKMDKNKDGKLTLEEFTEGMKQLHKDMMEHARPMGPPPVAMPLGGPMPGPGNVMWIQRPMPGPGGVGGPGFAPAGPGGPGGPAAWGPGPAPGGFGGPGGP